LRDLSSWYMMYCLCTSSRMLARMTWCRSVSMYLKASSVENRTDGCPQNEERKGAKEGGGGGAHAKTW
jgi:hypothetical protein